MDNKEAFSRPKQCIIGKGSSPIGIKRQVIPFHETNMKETLALFF